MWKQSVIPDLISLILRLLPDLRQKHGLPLIVDNTFGACGYLFRPIDYWEQIL